MAFEPGQGGSPEDEDKKKRRGGGGESTIGGVTSGTTSSTGRRVGTVDRDTGRVLPARLVLSLAGLTNDDKEIARAARQMARRYDISPRFVFGDDWRNIPDPETGGRLSAATVRRLTNDYAAPSIAAMLANVNPVQSGEKRDARGATGSARTFDTAGIGKTTATLARAFPANDFAQNLGLAVGLSQAGIDRKRFAGNLEAINRWAKETRAGFDPGRIVNLAAAATTAKKNLRTNPDVVTYLIPSLAEKASVRADLTGGRGSAAFEAGATATARTTETVSAEEAEHDLMELSYTPVGAQVLDSLDTVSRKMPDFTKTAKALEQQIRLDDTAFERSWLGQGLELFVDAADGIWDQTNRAVVIASTGIQRAGVLATKPFADAEAYARDVAWVQQRGQTRMKAIDRGDSIGGIIQKDYALPTWTAPAIDFIFGWYADPFVVFGKGAGALRAGRVLPRTNEPFTLVGKIADTVPGIRGLARARRGMVIDRQTNRFKGVLENFTGSTFSKKLYNLAWEDEGKFLREIEFVRTNTEARSGLDFAYMKALRDRIVAKHPIPSPAAFDDWKQGLTAHFGFIPPKGTLAEDVVRIRTEGDLTAERNAFLNKAKPADDAGELTEEVILAGQGRNVFFGSNEIPAFGKLRNLGLRRATRRALTSEKVTGTAAGRRAGRLISYNPGRVMPLENPRDVATYVVEHARRHAAFPDSKVREFEARALRDMQLPNKDHLLQQLVDDINNQAFDIEVAKYNLTDAAKDELRFDIFEDVSTRNQRLQAFGVRNVDLDGVLEGIPITKPLTEVQLQNFRLVVDPIQMRIAVRQYVGATRRLEIGLRKTLRKSIPEISEAQGDFISRKAIELYQGTAKTHRAFRRAWKGGVVIRPAYIPRVIGEENLRNLAVLESLSERVFSSALRKDFVVQKLDASGFFDEPFKLGDEVITLKRPGAQYEYESRATTSYGRETELAEEMLRDAKIRGRAMEATGDWDVIKPTMSNRKQHLSAWRYGIEKHLVGSVPGEIALGAVVKGKNLAATEELLLAWAKADQYTMFERAMGYTRHEVQEWASDLAAMAHGYTAGDKSIAELALSRSKALESRLNQIPLEARPTVHGPTLAQLTTTRDFPWHTRVLDRGYETFIRQPEDILNRQPTFRAFKYRAEKAYLESLQRQIKADPALGRMVREGTEARVWPSASRGEFIDTSDQLEAVLRAKNDQYWYHQTKADPAELAESGLTPRFRLDEQGNVRPWEGGSTEGRVYFAPAPEFSTFLTDLHAGPMLRVKRSAVPDMKPGMFAIEGTDVPAEYITSKAVKGKDLEFLGTDEKWHPLSDAAKTFNRPMTPRLRNAIDTASTDYALAQVKRVMFDFTRQSRFTELLQTFFPFPQPFFEGFQAWAHIAWRNPQAVGRARTLFQAGVDSGFLTKDESTGEYVVPMGLFARLGAKAGLMPDRARGISFTAPLASFNMLSQTTVPFPNTGILGDLAGGMPVPVPGFDPLAAFTLKKIFDDPNNETMASWLFQYGPSTPFLPRSIEIQLRRFVPEVFGYDEDARTRAAELAMLQRYKATGAHKRPDGSAVPSDVLAQWAEKDARDLLYLQGTLSLFSPASLQRSDRATAPLDREFQALITKHGFAEAARIWNEELYVTRPSRVGAGDFTGAGVGEPTHPEVPVGSTHWTPGYTDPESGELRGAPRLPASEYAARLFAQEPFQDFAKRHPEWMALLLVGSDPAVTAKFDFPTFSRQVFQGLVKYKDNEEYWGDIENAGVWSRIDRFYKQIDTPIRDQAEALHLDDSDAMLQDLARKRRAFFLELHRDFPTWVNRNLIEVPGGYDWSNDPDRMPARIIFRDARAIVNTPGFQNFPGVKALGEYLDGRDAIRAEAIELGISSIRLDSAEDAGLTSKYEALVNRIKTTYPDFAPFLDSYFREDLTRLPTARQTVLNRLDEGSRKTFIDFDTDYNVLRRKASRDFDVPWQRNQAYQDVRELIDNQLRADPKIVDAWWDARTEPEKREYRENLIGLPAVFYSRFDWKVQGVEVSDQASDWLNRIAKMRVQVDRKDQNDPTYSASEGYDAIDRFVREHLGKDKTFREVVEKSNSWVFPLEAAGLADQPGKVGAAWTAVIDAFRDLQPHLKGYMGRNYGTDVDRQTYANTQKQYLAWIKSWHKESAGFKEQWYDLQQSLGDPLIGGLLIPDDYFLLGG